ncbi:hypothetical protein BH09SUM1_BH09SUM1_22340 [soil metagenome]
MTPQTPPIPEIPRPRPVVDRAAPGAGLGGEEKFHRETDEAADLKRRFSELKARVVPVWENMVSLVLAQSRLTKAQVQERARLFLARGIILTHVWVCAVIAWIFLNKAIYLGLYEGTGSAVLPSLAVVFIHAGVIAGLLSYYRSLRL